MVQHLAKSTPFIIRKIQIYIIVLLLLIRILIPTHDIYNIGKKEFNNYWNHLLMISPSIKISNNNQMDFI